MVIDSAEIEKASRLGSVRMKALSIVGKDPTYWTVLVRQHGQTNPTEVEPLAWLISIANEKGTTYLRELCRQASMVAAAA